MAPISHEVNPRSKRHNIWPQNPLRNPVCTEQNTHLIFGANFLWAVNFFKGSLWIKQIKIVSCKKGTQKIYENWASKCNIVLIDKLLVL